MTVTTSGPILVATLLTALAPPALFGIAAALLVAAFFFALFENALQHYSRVRLMAQARTRGNETALAAVLEQEDDIFFASKVGRGVTQLVGVAILVAGVVYSDTNGNTTLLLVALGLGTAFLVLNVAAPYVLGRRFGDALLLRMLIGYARVITPLTVVARVLHGITASLFRASPQEDDPREEIEDEILSAVDEGAREGTLEDTEKRMIEGVIDLRDIDADHIMTPRTEMVCLAVASTVEEAVGKARERGLSRLPVYRETPDDIAGVLYMKDLLPYLGHDTTPPIGGLLRTPLFVPQTKNVRELLQEMRARQMHLAIVLDEYGGTAGLVTIEDILEEIVGEIADEHENAAPDEVTRLSENAATVEGRTHIDDLNDALDIDLPESEEYETVGGLLFTQLGRVPSPGEHWDAEGIRFTVLDSDERRIHRVKVTVSREAG
ncbi:MAG: hemolysin family protein [Planctomycetota bacterium]